MGSEWAPAVAAVEIVATLVVAVAASAMQTLHPQSNQGLSG